MTKPDSFTPRTNRPRPNTSNAHRVGHSDAAQATPRTQKFDAEDVRAMRDASARSARSAQPTRSTQSTRSSEPARQSVSKRGTQPQRRSIMPQTNSEATAEEYSCPRGATRLPQRRPDVRTRQSTPDTPPSYPVKKPRAHTQQRTTPQSAPTPRTPRIPKITVKRPKLRPLAFILIIALIAWPIYLLMYGNSRLQHVDALTGTPDTPGDTFLIVGSDKRDASIAYDGTEGQRSDTIMVLQLPEQGHASLVSLPRDTLVDIPGYGPNKINAAYAYGGPTLLVATVEQLTGLTVDHYIEVSMNGVNNLVDAVGGVNVCYDADVSDAFSGMEWTAGCHDVNGTQALSFSRMRYADPLGDIGRAQRQRQVVSKVVDKALSPQTLVNPMRQRALVSAGASNLATDPNTSIFGLVQAAVGLRSVMVEGGLMGAPPISNMSYWHNGQSCVQLNPDTIGDFWIKMREGTLTAEDFNNSGA